LTSNRAYGILWIVDSIPPGNYATMSLSIIIPTYNEGQDIKANLKEVYRTLNRMGYKYEMVVSDNGSEDNTIKQARNFSDCIVSSQVNQGKGHAICRGLNKVKGKYTVLLDADLAIHPAQIKWFVKEIEKGKADIVIGSKHHPQSKVVKYPLVRKIMSKGYYWLVYLLFRLPVRDTQTGLKLFKTEVLKEIVRRVTVKKFAFDLEVLVIARMLGYKIAEVPVVVEENRNRIKLGTVWRMLIDTLGIWYRLNILRWYQ